jgi:hypothetical protein
LRRESGEQEAGNTRKRHLGERDLPTEPGHDHEAEEMTAMINVVITAAR